MVLGVLTLFTIYNNMRQNKAIRISCEIKRIVVQEMH